MPTRKLGEVATERLAKLHEMQKDPDRFRPVPTGLIDLDSIVKGGFPRGAFYISVIGQDKRGKSTLGFQLFTSYCERTGEKGILYDLEENEMEAADRAMTIRSARVSRTNIYKLELTDEDFEDLHEYAAEVSLYETYVNDQIYKLADIIADAKKQGASIICIDNFQLLVDGTGRDTREKLESLSKIIMRARNNDGMRIFLLAQGNEKDKSFGSSQVLRDANLVILIEHMFEASDKKKKSPLQNLRKLSVTRSRWSGTGELEVVFQPEFSRVRTVTITLKDPILEDFASFEQLELVLPDEEEPDYVRSKKDG